MITPEEFHYAKTGDLFIDSHGNKWMILATKADGMIGLSDPEVFARNPEGIPQQLILRDGKIVDGGYNLIRELNHIKAKYVPVPA